MTSFILFIFQYLHVFINEVTALVPVLRDSHYAFAVYTAQRTKQRWPLVLAAQTEKDMNDWVTATQKHRKCSFTSIYIYLLKPIADHIPCCLWDCPVSSVVPVV